MPHQLTWDNADDIGILLSQTHPELNPLEVGLSELERYIVELPEFKGDTAGSNPSKLEAIQMAWQEEFLDRTQG